MDQRVQTVINLMRDNTGRKLSLSAMAPLVNLSLSRLRYLFRAETGISPTQYLRLIRMQQAKDLLETTFLSVKEIMNNIGVNDKSHFMREFKKIHGVTPARYRTRLATSNDAPKSTENL